MAIVDALLILLGVGAAGFATSARIIKQFERGLIFRFGRVREGIRGPGQMGNKRVTQRGLEVVEVMPDQNLLLLRGSVPGPRGAIVEIRSD